MKIRKNKVLLKVHHEYVLIDHTVMIDEHNHHQHKYDELKEL